MMNYRIAIFLFILVAGGSYFARSFGWYNDYWFTDVILHTISGVALGCAWFGITYKSDQPFWMRLLGALSFAVCGSVVWEWWEFFGWRITPSHTQFYIPELGDTLGDVACGLVGGVLASCVAGFKK